jgi:flagellar hook-associated protein 3 FlgL
MSKLETASANLKSAYVQVDAKASFLESNDEQLETKADTLNEQFLEIEQCDLADAITSFSWAQYCYNAALKVGNSILSQSLIDYMN